MSRLIQNSGISAKIDDTEGIIFISIFKLWALGSHRFGTSGSNTGFLYLNILIKYCNNYTT